MQCKCKGCIWPGRDDLQGMCLPHWREQNDPDAFTRRVPEMLLMDDPLRNVVRRTYSERRPMGVGNHDA